MGLLYKGLRVWVQSRLDPCQNDTHTHTCASAMNDKTRAGGYLILVLLARVSGADGGRAAGGRFFIRSCTDWSRTVIGAPAPTNRPWLSSVSSLWSQHSLKNSVYDAATVHNNEI